MRNASLAMAIVACGLIGSPALAAETKSPDWVEPMRQVHGRYSGKPGTLALLGDSISVSLAFWAPLAEGPKPPPEAMAKALARVRGYQRGECWRQWRGPQFGNEGGMTIRWADKNVDAWLKKLNPEVAVILFGTNDLAQLERKEYEAKTRRVVQRCLENGTVVLLTTIPPRHGLADKSAEFAEAVRRLADELKVPLVDYHAEVLRRRPKDWDGSLPQFRQAAQMGGPYDVPTLIAADGVHPSFPKAHQDYSPESLTRNGYALRNYLTLLRYAEVIDRVLGKEGAGDLGLETWGWGPEAGGRERKDRGSEDEGQDECRTSRGAEAVLPSRWSLKLGHWSLKLGRWSLKLGHWSFGGRW